MSTAVHRSPNKLWRSNSIFNLRGQSIPDLVCVVIADAKPVHSLWFASSSWAKEFKWSKRLCLTGIDPGYYRKTTRFFKNEIILAMPSLREVLRERVRRPYIYFRCVHSYRGTPILFFSDIRIETDLCYPMGRRIETDACYLMGKWIETDPYHPNPIYSNNSPSGWP
jgi:hypothetical protein